MKFTVLGSTGFIGGTMARHLRAQGFEVDTPPRNVGTLRGKNLGHVIYAIGMTGNFRTQPQATIEAHVNVLQKLMDGADFESWLYLSSTRVYGGLPPGVPATEDTPLPVRPGSDSLYDLSKLLGESICLGRENSAIRVVRLANVYGEGVSEHLFLGSIIRDLKKNGKVTIGESPLSSKDYVSVDTAAAMLQSIATQGRERLYNIASGRNVTHHELADVIRQCGYEADFTPNAPIRIFPAISTARMTGEFGANTRSILTDLPSLIKEGNAHAKDRKNEQARS